MNYSVIKTYFQKYWWLLMYLLIIFFFFKMQLAKSELKRNRTFAYGIVTRSSKILKTYSKRTYHYEFFYEKKKYYGNTTGSISENIKVGNRYKVEFSSKKPENNKMLFHIPFRQKDSITKTHQ